MYTKIRTYIQSLLRKKFISTKSIDELYGDVDRLHPFISETIATPELNNIPLKGALKYIQRDCYTTPDIYSLTISNAIYYSKYEVILSDRKQLILESIKDRDRDLKYPQKLSLRTLYSEKPEKIFGYCSLFRSITNPKNIYHSLIDYIPRIYLLHQPEYQNIEQIKLLISSELTDIEKFFVPKLLPKNVSVKVVNPKKIYSIENFIFPSFLSNPVAGYLIKPYLDYFDGIFSPKRKRKKLNRIFISRKENNHKRSIENEDEVIKVLNKYGFSVYYFEDLSFDEKIDLIHDAEIIIGTYGGGLTNLLFSKNIKVLELCSTSYINPHFYYLSKSRGNSHYFLQTKKPKKLYDNYEVDIIGLVNWLQKFA